MANEMPWSQRVPMLSINPKAATADDVERLASEHMNLRGLCWRLVEYRRRVGPLEFQLEKADGLIQQMKAALECELVSHG